MEDEAHLAKVLTGQAAVNLSPSAVEYFSRVAIERGWDGEEYGLQVEYLLTTALEKGGRTAEVYRDAMRNLRENPPEFTREPVTQRRRSSVQEEVEYRQGDFHRRAKQCHALDAHSFANKPRTAAKEAHDRRKQKMMDAYEVYVLEVKGAQQALPESQTWVDQRISEAKRELGQAQSALERFLAEAMALASNRESSRTPEKTPLTRRTPRKTQRILVMERDTNQLLQEVERVVKSNAEGQYQTMFDA